MIESHQEVLYLCKGEKTVYINNYNKLTKPQINGIRFLYSQFANKRPGVMINDPPGSSQVKQVVVFLNAIRELFAPNPVLILTHAEHLEHWMKYLQRYSQFGDEVLVEESNPCKRKLVYLNSFESGLKLCNSRKWSIIVVDDNTYAKNILLAKMDNDFKIWITSDCLQKNLKSFSLLYKWLYPKEKFEVKDFEPDKKNLRDVINKAIMWDAFTQDILVRSNDSVQNQLEAVSEPVKVTLKKNKDPSGKKSKNSKRKLDEPSEDNYDIHFDPFVSKNNETEKIEKPDFNVILDTQDSPEINLHFDDSDDG